MATEDTSFARLVSLACHDLRTPLATVHGFARTITRAGDLGEPTNRYVQMIEEASGQIAQLLDELGLAARIQSGRYEPALTEVDTLALAHTAAASLGEERVRIEGTGGTVRVDAEAVEQAVTDLARCALRHGGLDQVTVRADGAEVTVSPITPASAPVVLGEELRDLGAAVAGRAVRALGGSVELDGDQLRIRLPS
jgi:signal transduction histidine kinase